MSKLLVAVILSLSMFSVTYAQKTEPVDVNKNDFIDETALHDAVRAKDIEVVKFLIEQKANINAKDQFGYTPLHLAVRYHDLAMTKFLLKSGATINNTDEYGDTPLLDSTRNNDTEISKLLICNKVKRDVADNHGMTTLHNATKNQNLYIAKLLRVDYVELYCQDKIEISIDKTDSTSDSTPKICGKIDVGYVSNMSLGLTGADGKKYGEYNVGFNNDDHTWCAQITDDLPKGKYKVLAKANDYVVNKANAKAEKYITSPIKITIDDLKGKIYDLSPKICGDIRNAYAKSVDLTLTPTTKDEISKEPKMFGAYKAQLDNPNRRWCVDVNATLPEGEYVINTFGLDENENSSKAKQNVILKSTIAIDIDPVPLYNDSTPKICGRVLRGDVLKIDLSLKSRDGEVFGKFSGDVDTQSQTWCINVEEEIPNNDYLVTADGFDAKNNMTTDKDFTRIYIITGLYEALMGEFVDDFEPWKAELDKDTLTFRFKDPTLLFKIGKSSLREQFKKIVADFFPRYVKILKDYEGEIVAVRIEGHSSSEHSRAKNEQEKFELNRQLSQARANAVHKYATALEDEIIEENSDWIKTDYQPVGMSYSQLIYNLDGSENKELSRRVEFKILTKSNEEALNKINGNIPQ